MLCESRARIIPVTRPNSSAHCRLAEPILYCVLAHEVKVPHLRMDEMVCNFHHDIHDGTVRDDRNYLVSLLMILK